MTFCSCRARSVLLASSTLATAAITACQSKPEQQIDVTPAKFTPFWDSLVRAVPMDSVGRLLHAMLNAEQPKPIARELVCELARLGYTRGNYVVGVAYQRLQDTLLKREVRDAQMNTERRMAGALGGIRMTECHVPLDLPKAPDSLNAGPQIRLDTGAAGKSGSRR